MASAPVDIPIRVKGLSDLQKLEQKMEQLEREVSKLNAKLPKASNNIKKTGRAAASATGNVQRLGIAFRTTLAPIVAITGSIALMSKALNTVGGRNAELAALKNGLNGLVDSSDAAAEALLKIADQSAKATLFDEEDFTATFKLLTSFRNIGVDAYDRVSMAAADMAQVIGTKPKEAAMQLAKALEDPSRRVTDLARSGTVFTEQQKEQIKALQQSGDLLGAQGIILAEIEKQYGGAAKAAGASGFAGALDGAGESWRDFLEVLGQGSESGAVEFLNGISKGLDFLTQNFDVISAVASAAVDVIVAPFKAMQEGIQSVVQPIGDFESIFRGTLGVVTKILTDLTQNILIPVFKVVGQGIGQVINWLAGLVGGVGTAMEGIVSNITGALRIIAQAMEAFINASPLGLLQLFGINAGAAASGALNNFANGIDSMAASVGNYASELKEAYAAAQKVPGLNTSGSSTDPFAGAGPRGASGAGTEGSGGSKSATTKTRELEKQQKIQDDIVKSVLAETAAFADQLRSLSDQKALLEGKLNGNEREVRLTQEIRDATEGLPAPMAAYVEERLRSINALELEIKKQDELNTALTDSEQLLADAYNIVANNLTSGIQGLINGTKEWGDILSDILGQLGSMFLNSAFKGIGAGLGLSFDGGGYTGSGARSGGIDGKGGFPAILHPQETVVDHTRPTMDRYSGGNEMAAMGSSSVNVNYNVTDINGMRFVTEDQFQAGMTNAAKQGAKAGETRVMASLRNKRSSRSAIGL